MGNAEFAEYGRALFVYHVSSHPKHRACTLSDRRAPPVSSLSTTFPRSFVVGVEPDAVASRFEGWSFSLINKSIKTVYCWRDQSPHFVVRPCRRATQPRNPETECRASRASRSQLTKEGDDTTLALYQRQTSATTPAILSIYFPLPQDRLLLVYGLLSLICRRWAHAHGL